MGENINKNDAQADDLGNNIINNSKEVHEANNNDDQQKTNEQSNEHKENKQNQGHPGMEQNMSNTKDYLAIGGLLCIVIAATFGVSRFKRRL